MDDLSASEAGATDRDPVPDAMSGPDARRRRRYGLPLRALCLGQAVLAMVQPVLAGHLLVGNEAARSWHGIIGSDIMLTIAGAQVLAAVLLWRPGRGPAWPIVVTAALLALVVAQISWGFDGRLTLHVPIGVAFLLGQLVLVERLRSAGPADGC